MNPSNFEAMLKEGKINSLGRVEEVVAIVLSDHSRLDELYQCYFSDDEWVRLRVSSCMKRVCREKPSWIMPYLDKLLDDISQIDQASTQWTLAILFLWLTEYMNPDQHRKAKQIMQHNLKTNHDWIVQNTTMETLGVWARSDDTLRSWLLPELTAFTASTRKSVAGRAKMWLTALTT